MKPKETLGVKLGPKVSKGEVVGYLGRTRTHKDHVHYCIYKDTKEGGKEFFDPQSVFVDAKTGAVLNQKYENSCFSYKRIIDIVHCIECDTTVHIYSAIYFPHGKDANGNSNFSTSPPINGRLCGESIIHNIKWSLAKDTGIATTADNWKSCNAILPRPLKKDEKLYLISYGVDDKQLEKISVTCGTCDISAPKGFKLVN